MTTDYRVVPVRRTPIGLVILLLVCLVVALGFYLGWFKVSEHKETLDNKTDINLRVDTGKMKNDVRKAADTTEQKASDVTNKIKQDAKDIKTHATNKG